MKKYLYIASVLITVCACDSTTYENLENNTKVEGKATYIKDVKTIIDANCVGCHSNSGTASFAPLQTYEQVKELHSKWRFVIPYSETKWGSRFNA